MDEAAEALHVALAGGGQHGAGTEKQEALEDRMVEHVEQRSRQRQGGGDVHVVGAKRQRQSEADENDADVFDRVIGQEPLQIVLHQGIQNPDGGADPAERQDRELEPWIGRAGKIQNDADEAVNADFRHHATEQRRRMAWRGRMGEGQPDMKRHQAGLRSGAEKSEHHRQCRRERRVRSEPDGLESVAARRTCQKPEAQKQAEGAEARHHEIEESRPAVCGIAMAREHHRP
jgi:hypothetical protein